MSQVRIEGDVMVPVRDGVCLATDVYLPTETDGAPSAPLPVILERTPYDKRGIARSEFTAADPTPVRRSALAEQFANHGYVVVMQDCRGRYRSEGTFTKYVHEAEDGFDTLAWLVEQPWCNGRVGTMGISYGAQVQLAMASLGPPGLACMFLDSGGFASAYHGGIRRGGAFELKQATWALRHARRSPATRDNPARRRALEAVDIADWFRRMPWRPGHSPLAAAPEYEAYLFDQWRHGTFSDYWTQRGLCAERFYDECPDVPVAIVGSWYDPYVYSCLTNFGGLSRRHRAAVALFMGPWTHGDRSVRSAGDVDFGPRATLDGNIAPDYRALRLAWFDRWLKGAEAPAFPARVTYFEMGGGRGGRTSEGRLDHGGTWRSVGDWPPPGVTERVWFLRADGRLLTTPADQAAHFTYRYDPAKPLPTIGGSLTSGEPVMRGGAFDQRTGERVFTCRPTPAGEALADRPDVLVFATDVLIEDLIVTGDVVVELWVSSDCPDTDFTAKLIDWYPPDNDHPDGFAMNVTDGIFRMRYRDGWDREVFMRPDEVYRIQIAPFATANRFQAGHRLRLDISSSNYPHFDLNPNTSAPVGRADGFAVATNRVYLAPNHRSCVRLSMSPLPTG